MRQRRQHCSVARRHRSRVGGWPSGHDPAGVATGVGASLPPITRQPLTTQAGAGIDWRARWPPVVRRVGDNSRRKVQNVVTDNWAASLARPKGGWRVSQWRRIRDARTRRYRVSVQCVLKSQGPRERRPHRYCTFQDTPATIHAAVVQRIWLSCNPEEGSGVWGGLVDGGDSTEGACGAVWPTFVTIRFLSLPGERPKDGW